MSKDTEFTDMLVKSLPKEMKAAIIALCGATMEVWETHMTEEEKEEWGSPQFYLGTQIMLACEVLLED